MTTGKCSDWADGLRDLQRLIDRAADMHGEDAVKAAVENLGWTRTRDERGLPLVTGGRPLALDHQALMETWLFVEAGTQRTGLSVNAFCAGHTLAWVVPGGGRGLAIAKKITGPTLRRRYHQAKAFLLTGDAATVRWWQDELKRRLAAG